MPTEIVGSIDQFLDEMETSRRPRALTGKMSPATIRQYTNILTFVWLPWFRENARNSKNAAHLLNLFEERLQSRTGRMSKKSLSEQTIRTYVKIVRIYLKWAEVPTKDYVSLKAPERDIQVLTRDEIDRMERAARSVRDKLIVRTLADTGIRVGEMVGLRGQDLKIESRNKKLGPAYYIEVRGKTGRRKVPCSPETWGRLKKYADLNGDEFIFMATRSDKTGKVNRLTESGAGQMISNLGKEAKINKRVYPHLFRHSFATQKLSDGMDSVTLMTILGHRNLDMIAEVYAHLSVGQTYDAMMRSL